MDTYIKARLERAEMYLNQALGYSKGTTKPFVGSTRSTEGLIQAGLKAGLDQFKKVEKYIHQCGAQTQEDAQYHSIIE